MRPGSSLPNSEHRSPVRPSQSGVHMQQLGIQPSRQGPPPAQRPQQQPYLPQQPSPLDLDHAIQKLQQLQRLQQQTQQQQTQQQQTQQPARFVNQQDKIINELDAYHRRRALPPVHSPTTTMAVWQSQQPEQQQPRESPYDAQLTMAYDPHEAPQFVSSEETLQRGVLPTPKARPGLRPRSLLNPTARIRSSPAYE